MALSKPSLFLAAMLAGCAGAQAELRPASQDIPVAPHAVSQSKRPAKAPTICDSTIEDFMRRVSAVIGDKHNMPPCDQICGQKPELPTDISNTEAALHSAAIACITENRFETDADIILGAGLDQFCAATAGCACTDDLCRRGLPDFEK